MKLKDMFISEDQFAADTILREAIEEEWVKEAHGENAIPKRSGPGSEKSLDHDRMAKRKALPSADDFGDEPDDFSDKTVATSFGGEDVDQPGPDDEFKGAPADPMLAPGFETDHDDSTFSGEPVFGDVPEPIVDPEAELWHGNMDWGDEDTGVSGPEHKSSVSFPDYEGPKARSSYHPEDKPDDQGFYPRASSKPKSKRR